MTTIVTRTGKGSPLTHVEVDTNFTNLNTNKLEAGAIVLGSAATPSISFTGDTNTGIYSPGADQVAVATNGVGRLFVTASGSIGVGTSSPTSYGSGITTGSLNGSAGSITDFYFNGVRQGLVGTFASNEMLIDTAGAAIPLKLLTNSAERARIRADGTFEIKGGGTSGVSPGFSVSPSTPADSFVIDSSGRLGIGTSSPSSKLDVEAANFVGGPAIGARYNASNVRLGFNVANSNAFTYIGSNTNNKLSSDTATYDLTGQAASQLRLDGGQLIFNNAPSGTAGNDITFTNRLTITSAGLVGIGTTGPDANSQLHIVGSGYQPLYVNTTGAGGGGAVFFRSGTQALYTGTAGSSWLTGSSTADGLIRSEANLIFATGGNNQRAQIDSSGRLLVGTSTTQNIGSSVGARIEASEVGANLVTCSLRRHNSANITGPLLNFGRSRGTTESSATIVQNNDELGAIQFAGADGVDIQTIGALIGAYVDGAPSADDLPTRLVFSTTADGASSPTERMRIKANGELWSNISFVIGKAGSFTNYGGYLSYDAGADRLIVVNNSGGGSAGVGLAPGATAWSTYSDERLKTDLVSIDNGLEKVCSLRAVTGRYNTDPEGASRSFLIAQDVQAVLPEAVSAAADEDAFLDLRYTEVIPLLVAALKESKERIEQLEQRLTAAGIA